MTTLLYGEKPEADVAPGNRADAEVDPGASGTHPRLLPTVELRATNVQAPTPGQPAAPTYPPPSPWGVPQEPLPSMMIGLGVVAAIFAGVAIWGIALAWWQSMSRLSMLGLLMLGTYLIAIGAAYIIATQPQRAPRT